MEHIGERIKRARDLTRLSQTDVANMFGITREAVSLWESGDSRPDQEKILKLAEILEVNVRWLLSGEGPMKQDELGILEDFDRVMVRLGRRVKPEDRELVTELVGRFAKD